ncbi:acyltransferase family protein [Evansella sp. LMS18]|uniref:acyltransferase family protein n=1 Tax=Evansella sp. LMS18 TaxID=2924033 RepID=UPI0020D042B3|nr:acyltransferase family protein [Evansella sp. LMS18]UTR09836.1 acyltransferase family protein [Evansella sp. LMS18]
MNKKIIKEIFWLRALACLAVVTVHAVYTTLGHYEQRIGTFSEYILILLRFLAFFGTPAFVFISELLLSRSYPAGVPKGFFKKRVQFLLVPFLFMAVVYAVMLGNTWSETAERMLNNWFLAGFTGYFVLIIFQFYLLHVLLHKKLRTWPAKIVLPAALLINGAYLAFFNFSEPANIIFADQIWRSAHWLPFTGWIFYFTLGYYAGRNYEEFLALLHRKKKLFFALPAVSMLLLIALVRTDILTVVSSKRIDILLYTTGMIGVIFILASYRKTVPGFIMTINKYSFNIYLLHNIFLYNLPFIKFMHPIIYFAFTFCIGVAAPIFISRLLSDWKYTPYLIGKTLPAPKGHRVVKQLKNKVNTGSRSNGGYGRRRIIYGPQNGESSVR